MFTHRALLLIVTVSLTNHALSDILVQPGYRYQYRYNPHDAQDHQVPRYHASYVGPQHAQYPFYQPIYPQLTPPFTGIPYYPYYGTYGTSTAQAQAQAQAQSAILGQFTPNHGVTTPPHTPNPVPLKHLHVRKVGDHTSVEPSLYVGSPYAPMIAHNRYKRSADPTNDAPFSEHATYKHHVAPQSSLINQKYPTAIDSLSAVTESESTNDKRVKTRQSTNNHGQELTSSTNAKHHDERYRDISIVPISSTEHYAPTQTALPYYYSMYDTTWRNFRDPQISSESLRHKKIKEDDKQQPSQQSDSENKKDTKEETIKIDYEAIGKAFMSFILYNHALHGMPTIHQNYFQQNSPNRAMQNSPYLINRNFEDQQNIERNMPSNTIPASSDLSQTQRSAHVYNYPIKMGYVVVPQTYKNYYSSFWSNYGSLPQINDHFTPIVTGYNQPFFYYR